ncbi:MAG: hypothetical protein RIC19_09680 [Phaeodactylibacter sp.]|jgi:hypothetical protein|uniref:hypothetical protein n=1 Tax=Phaeodactylibacter TaxID=1564515 RepID=UPI0032EDE4B9
MLTIELIDPRARSLLDELVKLNLIRIQENPSSDFRDALQRVRERAATSPLSDDEIRAEVEAVRAEQHGKSSS